MSPSQPQVSFYILDDRFLVLLFVTRIVPGILVLFTWERQKVEGKFLKHGFVTIPA